MTVRKAVLPVAGLGTRFLPITKAIPKEMLPVLNKPLIEYAIEETRAAGITDIVFVNGRGKSALEDYFDHAYEVEATLKERGKTQEALSLTTILPEPGRYAFIRQSKPGGLGHAILCAETWIGKEPFAVILPDDLFIAETAGIKQLTDVYELSLGNLAAVVEVPADQTQRYGVFDVEKKDGALIKARHVVEKPHPSVAPSREAILGRYILHPDIFTVLRQQPVGVGGEIQLTDALARMISTHGLHGHRLEGFRFDCGSVEGMVAANVMVGLQVPHIREQLIPLLEEVLSATSGGSTK